MTGIIFEEVSKRFQNQARPAVNSISLTVKSGELVVLLGPSGCGKTTLLKTVNRLYEPDTGRILLDEGDVRHQPLTALRRRMGYVIQQVGLFPHMSVEKNIAVVPQLLGWDRQRIDERIDALLELVGLPLSYRKRPPNRLSGGEQQRVGLARALAADPEILLMDEPFASIDAFNRARLQDELLDIQRRLHKTILFVTHDLDEALRLADWIAVLNEGRLEQFGRPQEILTQPCNEFVGNLVGAGDILRRMSLLNVQTLLAARPARQGELIPNHQNKVGLNESLRNVLAQMLDSGNEKLIVVDEYDKPVDWITFEDLRAALVRPNDESLA